MDVDAFILAGTRALHMGCALLLVALPFFAAFVWMPLTTEASRHALFWRNVLRVMAGLLAVEVLTGLAWLWEVAASLTNAPDGQTVAADIGMVLTQTRFGLLWVERGGIALALGLLLVALAMIRLTTGTTFRVGLGLALALAGALLGSLAWAGHAAAELRWPGWHVAVDLVHLLAGAVWPMGLVPLTMFLASSRLAVATMEKPDVLIVQRYSNFAFAGVLAVVASGVANGWLMIPSWSALPGSVYGRWLLAKGGVVIVMIALGGLNHGRFLPTLGGRSPLPLARVVAVESGLAVVVLVIVGIMGMTAPPPF